MRKYLIATMAFSVLAFTSCEEKNPTAKIKTANLEQAQKRDQSISVGAPIVQFDRKVHDFGTVKDGAIIETVFTLTNKGKSDLVITDAKTTCGCTVPSWPKNKPIKPGETTEIRVQFNTAGKGGGRQSKDVTLFTNTAIGREVVTLKGVVKK